MAATDSDPARLRRALTRGGGRWTSTRALRDCTDPDGWRGVAELGHWQDGRQRVRLKKYHPSGRFYFCEGITLSLGMWDALRTSHANGDDSDAAV